MGLRHIETSTGSCFAGQSKMRDLCRGVDWRSDRRVETEQGVEAEPYAWWTFDEGKTGDVMGHFTDCLLLGGARVADGGYISTARTA